MLSVFADTAIPTLPDDIITFIIIRSNSATFARCRSLSPTWNSILCDENNVWHHIDTIYGNCLLLQLSHPLFCARTGLIDIFRFKDGKQLCIASPFQWEWFSIIGSSNGYIFARYSTDRRNNQIIMWNPITHDNRFIQDPGSFNYHRNCCMAGLAIYAVATIPLSNDFKIALLHRDSNFDDEYKLQVFDSRSDTWTFSDPPPNASNLILQHSLVINQRVFWINLSRDYPKKPESILSYSTIDGSWSVSIIPPESQISHSPRLVAHEQNIYYIGMHRSSRHRALHIWNLTLSDNGNFQWGNRGNLNCNDLWTVPIVLTEDYFIGFSRQLVDLRQQTSSTDLVRVYPSLSCGKQHRSSQMKYQNSTVDKSEDSSIEIDFNQPISLAGSRISISAREPPTKVMKPTLEMVLNAKEDNIDKISTPHEYINITIFIKEGDPILNDTFSFWPNERSSPN
ncbi:hypothetical protein PIB30_019142 [Stylosanthes scabra]|uniref:F-box associated beta-propeller type 1 domain-containing protein n=1 Tax=Stylosanthes scabra TaxID=79078 RepID=A0ABU6X8X2_9FABA|nr:hypothetical protein [Stylosanthes scabra]